MVKPGRERTLPHTSSSTINFVNSGERLICENSTAISAFRSLFDLLCLTIFYYTLIARLHDEWSNDISLISRLLVPANLPADDGQLTINGRDL